MISSTGIRFGVTCPTVQFGDALIQLEESSDPGVFLGLRKLLAQRRGRHARELHPRVPDQESSRVVVRVRVGQRREVRGRHRPREREADE
jgi:hypothetical protein